MKDILFRGKRVDNEEWIQGSLHLEYEGIHDTLESAYIYGRYSKTVPSAKFGNILYGSLKVIPETVGQYTGLTDKNGKKIFEGDIVKVTGLYPDRDGEKRIWRQSRVGEIFYYHSAFYFDKWLLCKTTEKCLEIIGNIHDNPELIEADV